MKLQTSHPPINLFNKIYINICHKKIEQMICPIFKVTLKLHYKREKEKRSGEGKRKTLKLHYANRPNYLFSINFQLQIIINLK